MRRTTEHGFELLDHAFAQRQETRPEGHTFFTNGTEANSIYVIFDGLVQVTGGRGIEVGVGQVFGKEANYSKVYRSDATAIRETTVGSVDQGPLQQLFFNNPETALAWPGFIEGDRPNASETILVLPPLNETDLMVLQLSAAGASVEELTPQYSDAHSESYMRNYTHKLHTKFGVNSMSQAVFIAYKMGLISGDEAVRDAEPSLIPTLKPQQRRILELFTDPKPEVSEGRNIYKQIGDIIGLAEKIIGKNIGDMVHQLHARNRTHLGMMYLVAKKRGMLKNDR